MAENGLLKVTSRVTVQDTVYEQLRRALMWGSFAPAQAITISSLANEFGTSHMPVREALRRLAAENGLEIAHNGSARVPSVSRARLDDLCQARIALEGLATELACARMTDAEIDRAEALALEHEEMGKAGDVYGMLRKNQEFHLGIYELSRSEVLPQHIEMLWLRFGPYMRMLTNDIEKEFGEGVVRPFSSYHFRIVEAFRDRNAVLAREMMIGDILATQVYLRDMCPE